MYKEINQDRIIKAYLKEKEKQLAFIVGAEESKALMGSFYEPIKDRDIQFIIEAFEGSPLQKICEAAKVSMDREYYRQASEKLNSIYMVMVGLLIISILAGVVMLAAAL